MYQVDIDNEEDGAEQSPPLVASEGEESTRVGECQGATNVKKNHISKVD